MKNNFKSEITLNVDKKVIQSAIDKFTQIDDELDRLEDAISAQLGGRCFLVDFKIDISDKLPKLKKLVAESNIYDSIIKYYETEEIDSRMVLTSKLYAELAYLAKELTTMPAISVYFKVALKLYDMMALTSNGIQAEDEKYITGVLFMADKKKYIVV